MISLGLEMQHMLSVQESICLSRNKLTWLKGPEHGAGDVDIGWSFVSIKHN